MPDNATKADCRSVSQQLFELNHLMDKLALSRQSVADAKYALDEVRARVEIDSRGASDPESRRDTDVAGFRRSRYSGEPNLIGHPS
jgi:hypothetical protein